MEDNKTINFEEQEAKRKQKARFRLFIFLILISLALLGYLIYQIIALVTIK